MLSCHAQNMASLDEVLEEAFRPARLTGRSRQICPECKILVASHKERHICTFPRMLVLLLNRLAINSTTGFREKLAGRIEFPAKLDLSLIPGVGMSCCKAEDTQYELCGVILHQGTALDGHYRSIARHRDVNDLWILCDDEVTTLVSAAELPAFLHMHAYGAPERDSSQSVAHMLFYEKARQGDDGGDDGDKRRRYPKSKSPPPTMRTSLLMNVLRTHRQALRDEHFNSSDYFDLAKKVCTAAVSLAGRWTVSKLTSGMNSATIIGALHLVCFIFFDDLLEDGVAPHLPEWWGTNLLLPLAQLPECENDLKTHLLANNERWLLRGLNRSKHFTFQRQLTLILLKASKS